MPPLAMIHNYNPKALDSQGKYASVFFDKPGYFCYNIFVVRTFGALAI